MNDRMHHMNDDRLAQLLAETLDAYEPIPDAALDAAYAAIDMDLLSEELAALAFDSASAGELVAMRASSTVLPCRSMRLLMGHAPFCSFFSSASGMPLRK